MTTFVSDKTRLYKIIFANLLWLLVHVQAEGRAPHKYVEVDFVEVILSCTQNFSNLCFNIRARVGV